MKKYLVCKGHPNVYVKSLNRTFDHGEKFYINADDIQDDLRKKIKVGLFDYLPLGGKYAKKTHGVPAYMRGNRFFRNESKPTGGNTSPQQNKNSTVASQDTGLIQESTLRNILKDELSKVNLTVSEENISSPKRKTKRKPKEEFVLDDETGTIFIRPDEKELKGEVSIQGSEESGDSMDDAISKLKKKGPSNGKKKGK